MSLTIILYKEFAFKLFKICDSESYCKRHRCNSSTSAYGSVYGWCSRFDYLFAKFGKCLPFRSDYSHSFSGSSSCCRSSNGYVRKQRVYGMDKQRHRALERIPCKVTLKAMMISAPNKGSSRSEYRDRCIRKQRVRNMPLIFVDLIK